MGHARPYQRGFGSIQGTIGFELVFSISSARTDRDVSDRYRLSRIAAAKVTQVK
jgi:hypothetical protein